ncbi:hypothetical protein ACFWX5_03135 [[Kitasatospora] papulosa]
MPGRAGPDDTIPDPQKHQGRYADRQGQSTEAHNWRPVHGRYS